MIKILTILLSLILASAAIASESENFFVRISADKGEITPHPDGSFSIAPTSMPNTNAINITITPKLDWQLIEPMTGKMTVSPSKTGAYRLLSVLGEDSPTGEVHVCSYPVTTITNHLSSPRMGIDFEVDGSPFIYASPNTGCDIAVGGNANETATGLHEIITTYAPCPKCESVPAIPKEHSTLETSFDRYSWRITAGNKTISAYGTHISKTLPNVSKGAHQVSATCIATYSQCSHCTNSKTQITNAIVSELTIECPPWLGLDRTDAATMTTNTAIAHLTPEQDNLSCSWMNGSICQIAPSCDNFRCNIWQPDNNNASSSYLAETITASVGNASISTNFTVVKVDVTVEDIDENKEETEGFSLLCQRDEHNTIPLIGTNTMRQSILIKTEPQLPGEEIHVRTGFTGLMFTNHINEIGINPVSGLQSLQYKANVIPSDLFIIANNHSTSPLDGFLYASHIPIGACDLVKYTSIGFDFDIVSDNAATTNQMSLTDNREATITVKTYPEGIDTTSFTKQFSSNPTEEGEIVNKPMSTDISFSQGNNTNEWRTSKIYWYGILPDRECAYYSFPYQFDFKVNNYLVRSKQYRVVWPNERPRMIPIHSRTSTSSVIMYTNIIVNSYCSYAFALIELSDFVLHGLIEDIPSSCQYAIEQEKEEMFHKKQWLGEISSEEGGIPDCFKSSGLIYFARKVCANLGSNVQYSITNNFLSILTHQNTNAFVFAKSILDKIENCEISCSSNIWVSKKGLSEKNAKEYANYNAAFKYQCIYGQECGQNPTNVIHPSIINHNE